MAINNHDGTFSCSICGVKYPQAIKADMCRDGHDTVYIPMTSQELNGLLHFMNLGDPSLLRESLRERLEKYSRLYTTR